MEVQLMMFLIMMVLYLLVLELEEVVDLVEAWLSGRLVLL